MKIRINDKHLEVVMDVSRFKTTLKQGLDLYKSVKASCSIIENVKNITNERAWLVIYGETNWLLFLSRLKEYNKKEIRFRVYEIEFVDRVEFKSHIRDTEYKYIELTPTKVKGKSYLLINNLIKTPEAFVDIWLQKRIYNYTQSEFEKVVYNLNGETNGRI